VPTMKTRIIPLSKGKHAIIDEEDFELISQYKWSATEPDHRRSIYARTNIKDTTGKYYTERMHRIILGLEKGDGKIVDHVNGDGLDNRKINLRISSPSDNAANVSINRGNKSGYKGVSFKKDRGTWSTEIRRNGLNVYRSTSHCLHLAALKYNDNAVRIHGVSVWLNEVKECRCDECTSYKESKRSS
jgi:hypothetical protein